MTAMDSDPPTLVTGGPGEHCASCAAPLAADQRYCLNCGTRRAERRVPVAAAGSLPLAMGTAASGPPATSSAAGAFSVQRLGGAWGVAALLLVALGVGVIIGSLGGDDAQVAARPPVVTIAAGAVGGAAATPVANTAPAADEWPDQDGFTVQLGELPKDGTDQAAADAAKAAAAAKGADAPGVLDAGAHGLTDGQLVVYSGVFTTKKEATAALDGLKAAYPDARVITVKAAGAVEATADSSSSSDAGDSSSSAPAAVSKSKLKAAENLDPESFQKQSKKLPKTTALPGKAPPKDDAAPGGGGDAETIG